MSLRPYVPMSRRCVAFMLVGRISGLGELRAARYSANLLNNDQSEYERRHHCVEQSLCIAVAFAICCTDGDVCGDTPPRRSTQTLLADAPR